MDAHKLIYKYKYNYAISQAEQNARRTTVMSHYISWDELQKKFGKWFILENECVVKEMQKKHIT